MREMSLKLYKFMTIADFENIRLDSSALPGKLQITLPPWRETLALKHLGRNDLAQLWLVNETWCDPDYLRPLFQGPSMLIEVRRNLFIGPVDAALAKMLRSGQVVLSPEVGSAWRIVDAGQVDLSRLRWGRLRNYLRPRKLGAWLKPGPQAAPALAEATQLLLGAFPGEFDYLVVKAA